MIRALDESIHQEVWLIVRPYLVQIIAHFVVFCLTVVALILMLVISQLVIVFCGSFNFNPLVLRLFVYASDIVIIGHFIWYVWPVGSRTKHPVGGSLSFIEGGKD